MTAVVHNSRPLRCVTLVSGTSCCEPGVASRLQQSRLQLGFKDQPPRKGCLHGAPQQRVACRLAKLQICASRAAYADPHMSVAAAPAPTPEAHRGQPGAVWTAVILICATLSALAGAFTAFITYLRPVLMRMEQAALATETASKAMEQSAKEFEQTSLMFQADMPAMMTEIEAAAHEYRELGHTLNVMTAGFRGKNHVKDWSQHSMKRVAKDVSALTNALSPALEQWRKRISKIATSFEANKAATSGTAGKQLTKASQPPQAEDATEGTSLKSVLAGGKDSEQPLKSELTGGKDTEQPETEQTAAGRLQGLEETGQRLASAAVSLRPGSKDAMSKDVVRDKKKGRDTGRQDAGSVAGAQPAVKALDTSKAQVGAEDINAAAEAAEKVTSDVNQLVADLAQGSDNKDAVEDAYEQSAASQDLPGMTAEEQALLSQLRDQKQAAEFVYKALQRAEHAATAAATASGALQQAMQEAESQAVLSSSDEIPDGQQVSSHGRTTRVKAAQSKPRQASSPKEAQTVANSISAAEVDGSADESKTSTHNKQNSHESEVSI